MVKWEKILHCSISSSSWSLSSSAASGSSASFAAILLLFSFFPAFSFLEGPGNQGLMK